MTGLSRRRVVLGLTAAALASRVRAQERSLVDSVGRTVLVRGRPDRVMQAGPPASLFVYALAAEAMVGWVPTPPAEALPFLLPAVRALPAGPRLTGRDQTIDVAGIRALRPDLILDFGSVSAPYVTLADKVNAETGIPYALIDGKLDASPASLRLAGDLLGRRDRAEALAAWAAKTLASLDEAIAGSPAGRRPRVCVARGAEGLQSGVKGSGLTETVERAGAVNVAEGKAGRGGSIEATTAQITAWQPDLILAYDQAAYDAMRKALPGTKALLAPGLPWSWLGEPPSIQRLMGLRWLTGVFYRQESKAALAAATREFHRLFYGMDLTEAQLAELLSN